MQCFDDSGETDMSTGPAFSLFFLFLMSAGGSSAFAQSRAELALQVRNAETAFAATMAARDYSAFVSFLSAEAVFFSRGGVLRGKEAVAKGWKRYFEGTQAPFSWSADLVEVLDSGTLAFSSGPVQYPEGGVPGTFNSIWRLESDGKWRIIFDKGCPECDCSKSK